MNVELALKNLGLSEREARVYLALLDLGPTTTSKIIRKTGIASSKIYDVLEKLEHKGLVTHIIEKGKKTFHPTNPEKLFDLIKEKEASVNEALPTLKLMFEKTAEEVNAEIYKGKEGLKTILEDVIKERKTLFALGTGGQASLTLPYFMPHFYKRTEKNNIKIKALSIDNETTRKNAKDLMRTFRNIQFKFLPKQMRNLMTVLIYGDKVVIIPLTPSIESVPLAILVKNKESADSYVDYFEWAWSSV
ncbi:TrmB family transcriptional regulator [archaeon]|nr:TrmB family transcriptional regulator [archaeon]